MVGSRVTFTQKKLNLKNIKYSTQKINYSVPSKEVFTTTFPKTITLSAGTSYSLPITFKPHKKDVFEDIIEFETHNGEKFRIPVKALLPEYSLEIPEDINCGTTAAHDSTAQSFWISNLSELKTPFRWANLAPFTIEPAEGIIEKFDKIKCTVYFQPKDANTFVGKAVLSFGKYFHLKKCMMIRGVAKYPHILVTMENRNLQQSLTKESQIEVSFGHISLGNYVNKILKIQNDSDVDSSISIKRHDGTNVHDWVFQFPIDSNEVPAHTSLDIPIKFSPKLPFIKSVENFDINVSNKCGTYSIKCVGNSTGPRVALSTYLINFNQLNPGDVTTHPLKIVNNSSSGLAFFQILSDPIYSVFQFDHLDGCIEPGQSKTIIIQFRPTHPIQYHRRIVILVPDQEPLFLDLLGTCHDLYFRPHILKEKHLSAFQTRKERGLAFFSPETLLEHVKSGKISIDNQKSLYVEEAEALEAHCDPIVPLPAWKEYFYNNNENDICYSVPFIGQNKRIINFGNVCFDKDFESVENQLLTAGGFKFNRSEEILTLINNTKGSVLLYWTEFSSNADPTIGDSLFSVSPAQIEMSPGESVCFTISFKPNGIDRIFGCELEAYAVFKSQRQFELVPEEVIAPSFCVTINCIANTFRPKHEPFKPNFKVDQPQIVFPSVNPNETAFRSLFIKNIGRQPLQFRISDELKKPFSVIPKEGFVNANGLQIFTLESLPDHLDQYEDHLKICLNNRKDFEIPIPLLASADIANVELENNQELFFIPTNVNNQTSRFYQIANVSRVPICFEWKLSPSDLETVDVSSKKGTLMPNERSSQKWIFKPKTFDAANKGRCVIKVMLVVRGISPLGNLSEPKNYSVRVIGQVTQSKLSLLGDDYLDFGAVVVGSLVEKTITLMNDKESPLYYQLYVKNIFADDQQHVKSPIAQSNKSSDTLKTLPTSGIELSQYRGCLPARCKQEIRVMIRPERRQAFRYQIYYRLLGNLENIEDHEQSETKIIENVEEDEEAGGAASTPSQLESLFTALVLGVFPTVQITDAQGKGSLQWISKRLIWNNLSIDNLNVCLDSDPTSSEVLYNLSTRASFYRERPVQTRAILDLNLGAAPVNPSGAASEVLLLLENSGPVASHVHFMLPADLQMELEYWAETGEYTSDELHEMKVQDNCLFEIEPRRCTLHSGESRTLRISYRHKMAGTDRLPVLLKIDHGREIMLNLIGVTLELSRSYIHFSSRKHMFAPTPIGLVNSAQKDKNNNKDKKIDRDGSGSADVAGSTSVSPSNINNNSNIVVCSPRQIYQMYNAGAQSIRFRVDTTPIDQLNATNYNVTIMKCLTVEGVIQPGRIGQMEWEFCPLEARTYSIDVPIHLDNGDVAVITFTGIGYDSRQLAGAMPVARAESMATQTGDEDHFQPGQTGVPSVQSIIQPDQLARLSQERLLLGPLPIFCKVRRAVFLNNISLEHQITFNWNVMSSVDAQHVYVHPQTGKLQPNESIMLHLTFSSREVARFFNIDLICEIYDEYVMRQYTDELAKWEDEVVRQQTEFVITEKTLQNTTNKRQPKRDNRKSSAESRYKTLPPIVPASDASGEAMDNNACRASNERVWPKPERPKPFLLHLEVTARTFALDEYQQTFPDKWKKTTIDRTQMEITDSSRRHIADSNADKIETSKSPDANHNEAQVIEATMSGFISSLLEDSDFLEAIAFLPNEAIPYYMELPRALECQTEQLPKDKPAARDVQSAASNNKSVPIHSSDPAFDVTATENFPENDLTKPGEDIEQDGQISMNDINLKQHEKQESQNQTILQSVAFGSLVEDVLENMISNILSEANANELDLTARPRLIALPPRSSAASHAKLNNRS